jgi:dTMP kinase
MTTKQATMKKQPGLLICITGLDGAGKTSVGHEIQAALRKKGIECEYVWVRFESLLVNRAVAVLKKHVLNKDSDGSGTEEYLKMKSRLFQNRIAAAFYTLFVVLTYFWQILVKLWLPRARGASIVCDRYVYDTMIDLAADLPFPAEMYLGLLEAYLHLAPKPDMAFYIALPEPVAFCRKDDIPSLEYLSKRKALYDRVSKQYGMITLDGSQSLEEVQEMAKSMAFEYLKRG